MSENRAVHVESKDTLRIILASSSPRRLQICEMLGLHVTVEPSHVDEHVPSEWAVEKQVETLATQKARAIAANYSHSPRTFILGADTLVVVDNKILGKPADRQAATQMLRLLSGRVHDVWTGTCLIDAATGKEYTHSDQTEVVFEVLSEADIVHYLATGESLDKAGAYAVQGMAAQFIQAIHGDFFTVMGLSPRVMRLLFQRAGVDLLLSNS
ncbi:nucleoside triphosphate pyrophosphatase [Alicyclobacillus sp. SP_1]|jgi:septum formation protein|uniref:Maf family protein n=1 Tax=Alicyclobacillus sp. SP_1 TaxID=2942475 RepID=UPI00215897FA|nr:Maf family protein [Alicyclobacillus sp. SP_1]